LSVSRNLLVHGGHYATVAVCAAGGIGWTGHDTSSAATASMRGQIRVTARLDAPQNIEINYKDLPQNAAIYVTGPDGRRVASSEGRDSVTAVGTGVSLFPIERAGVYLAQLETSIAVSTQGSTGRKSEEGIGALTVSVTPRNSSGSQP